MNRKVLKFSIVMPVFNSAKTLSRSIGSILRQSYNNWELIAVDDGSTDDSYERLNELAEQDSRITVVHQNNMGPGAARNNGIKLCTGDYVAFLDSDDYWDNDYLLLVYHESIEGQKDLIFTDRVYELENGRFLKNSQIYGNRNCTKHEIICKQLTGVIPWGMGKVFKRELLCNISKGFSELNVGEEAVFSFNLVNAANSLGFVAKPIYHYVQNPNGQHKKGEFDPWRAVVETMCSHIKESNCYEEYRTTLNSFALRAMCISLYRISNMSDIADARKNLWAKYKEYRTEFDFRRLNYSALDKTSVIILMLLKCRMFSLIYLLSKYKAKIVSK